MRLRVVQVPKLHGSSQLRIQRWNGGYWDTACTWQVSGAECDQVLALLLAGALSQGISLEVCRYALRKAG